MATVSEGRGSSTPAGAPLASVSGPFVLMAATVAAFVVFWVGFVSLKDAWALPEYSHGPLIPFISLFLFLRELRDVPAVSRPVTDRWPGVVVLALGLMTGIMGNLAGISHIVTYSLIIWLAGLLLVTFGLRRGAMFWPALVHLIFMLPLPTFVYWQVSTYLQTVSSEIGVWIIALLGIPVYLDGNIIDLGVYKLQVAEACSGLRYLFPMLSFSYVFAVLYQGPGWHKAILLLSAAPITVAMNSFRIGMIGVMVENFGIEQAEGFLHTFEGWIIFIACVMILIVLAKILQQFTSSPKSIPEALDINFSGFGAKFRRIGDVTSSAALVVATALTVVAAVGWVSAPTRATQTVARDPLVIFPRQIGAWEGRPSGLLDPQIERVLGADDYYSANFTEPGSTTSMPVDLFIAFYNNQMDGSGIHSPEVCIPAGGWEVSAWRSELITLPGGATAEVNRAIIQKGAARQLVYYWFNLRGQRIAGDFAAKWLNLRDSITMRRSDGALLRLITPLRPDEAEEVAEARLEQFMTELLPALPRFIPE